MENLSQKKTTKLLPVVEEGWDEPVDRIESARFEDDGSIIAIAYSGDLPLAVKIDDEEIDVRPIEGDVIEDEDNTQFSEQPDRSLDDAAAQFSKIPEGTVKHVNGRDYFMHNSRWHTKENGKTYVKNDGGQWQETSITKPAASSGARRLRPEDFSDVGMKGEYNEKDWNEAESWADEHYKLVEKGIVNERLSEAAMHAKNSTGKDFRAVRAEGRIQAVAKVKDGGDHLYIALLGSAPWNNGLNDERSIRGAGKAMIASVIQESMDKGYGGRVELEDTADSRGFYDRFGFEHGKRYKGHRILTAEAASKFMDAYRSAKFSYASAADWMEAIDDAEVEGGCTAGRLDSEFDFAAPKKKNCVKGISCGGTCISANKICSRELDGEAKSMVAALRKRIKAGDKDAAAGLDKFRQTRSNPKSNLDRLLQDLDKIDLDSQFGLIDAGSVMREIRADLIDTGMPFERASELVDRIKMPEFSASFNEADLAKVRASAIEVFQLTNGVGSEKLKEFINTSSCAHAHFGRGQINVGYSTQSEIFHEIGHFAEEEIAGSVEKNTAWVKSRASGEPQELAVLTGSETYDKTELAYPDKFYRPYVGKIYPDATEVISMGLEKFGYGWEMANFYKEDPEHFKLIIDFLKQTRNVRN